MQEYHDREWARPSATTDHLAACFRHPELSRLRR
jgi:hypothetical protein